MLSFNVLTRPHSVHFAFCISMLINMVLSFGELQIAKAVDETNSTVGSRQQVQPETGRAVESNSDMKKQLVLSEYEEKETGSYKIWSEKGGYCKFLGKNWPPGIKRKNPVLLPNYKQFMVLAKVDLTVQIPNYV